MDKAPLMPSVGAGFALIAKRPVSVLVWGLVFLLLNVAPLAAMFAVGGRDLMAGYRELMANPESAAGLQQALARMQALQGLQLLCELAAVAIVYTAILRAVLKPEQSSWFSLRVGMAELRTAGVAVVLYILMVAAILAIIIVCAIPMVAVFAASRGEPSPLAVILVVLIGLGATVALLPVASRLAMALPMTVAKEQFRLFEAWPLTKGYGWKLTGIFLLILLIVLGVELVIFGACGIVVATMTGGFDATRMSAMFGQPDWLAHAAPLFIVAALLYLALISIILPITVAPWARAYQLIDQKNGDAASGAFE